MIIAANQDRKQRNYNNKTASTPIENSMSSEFKPHNKPLSQTCSCYPHFSDEKAKDWEVKESAQPQ